MKLILSDDKEWNICKLEKSGSFFILKASLSKFKDLGLGFDENELIIYPQFALAKGTDYVISKDAEIEPIRVSENMLPA